MEDKDFLGYFGNLGSSNTHDEIKQASINIVNTLLASGTSVALATQRRRASSTDEKDEKVMKAKMLAKLQEKYLKGDLGDDMSADLNYTLKRLISGVISEDHTIKKGFFIALVAVLKRFKAQIDLQKFMVFVGEETKVTKLMRPGEINAAILGKLMVMSAIVEAQAFQAGTSVNFEAYNKTI